MKTLIQKRTQMVIIDGDEEGDGESERTVDEIRIAIFWVDRTLESQHWSIECLVKIDMLFVICPERRWTLLTR